MKQIRLIFLLGCMGMAFTTSLGSEKYASDLEHFYARVVLIYAYKDIVSLDWEQWKAHGRERLAKVTTEEDFGLLLEHLLEHFCDNHAQVRLRMTGGQLPLPSASAVWALFAGESAIIEETGRCGYAAVLGLKPGTEIVEIDQVPVNEAVLNRLPPLVRAQPGNRAKQWALNALLTGRRGQEVNLLVRDGEGERFVTLNSEEADRMSGAARTGLLSSKRIGSIGYIRLHDSLGDNELIAAFDESLRASLDNRAIILDLRDTPGGGNTEVARAIIGRFIDSPGPYQGHELVAVKRLTGIKRFWQEWVFPRPEVYAGPLVVLVNKWTGSMGEGLAIGLHGMGRATVVGTPMAQLLGAVYAETLPATGIQFALPAEKLFHINGSPRESFVPDYVVNLLDSDITGEVEDPILSAALDLLKATPLRPRGEP
jgi:C-terminal processing protease CtpA/Prc